MEIKNAVIKSTGLGELGRGYSSFLHLDYGGSSQGFGGYSLGGEFTHKWISGILKTLEVDRWEDLSGIHCRVLVEDGRARKIGHILKNQWYDPRV